MPAPTLLAANPHLLGVVLMVIATALFGVMDGLVKWLSADYPTVQIMFFRSAFALIPAVIMVRRGPGFGALRTRRLKAHMIRSCFGVAAMLCFFYSYRAMPLADVTAISFAAPFIIALLSVWLLKEKVGPHRWAAIAIGFIGMLVIVQPGQSGAILSHASLIVVLGTLLYALAMIQIRQMGQHEPSAVVAFYFAATCTTITALALPWNWVMPKESDLLLLCATGIAGGVAQLFMSRAYALAPAALVAPIDYTHLIWSVALGWFIWGDFPALSTWAGAAIIIASGLYILYRETVKRVETAPRWSE